MKKLISLGILSMLMLVTATTIFAQTRVWTRTYVIRTHNYGTCDPQVAAGATLLSIGIGFTACSGLYYLRYGDDPCFPKNYVRDRTFVGLGIGFTFTVTGAVLLGTANRSSRRW